MGINELIEKYEKLKFNAEILNKIYKSKNDKDSKYYSALIQNNTEIIKDLKKLKL